MSDHSQRIAELSPERRELLSRLLRQRGSRYNVFPLSFAQQRMWFLHRSDPGNPFYNVTLKLRLAGTLDAPSLERALSEIIRRHEVLRTTFTSVDGEPVQLVREHAAVSLPFVRVSGDSDAEREAEVERIAVEEARRPVDLEQGPVLRARLLRLDERLHVLLVITHHIVVDGWAIGVMLRELAALYEAYVAGRPSPLAPLPLQYAEFAARQTSDRRHNEAQLDYWRGQLDGCRQTLDLPTDRPRPSVQTYRGAHRSTALPRELADSLKALARQEGATLFMVLLAGYQALLHRHSGQEDFSIGTPVSGRLRAETEALVGLFTNTLALRSRPHPGQSFRELLARARQTCLEGFAHQDAPFDKVVEAARVERDPSRHPLVQVTFSLQNESLTQGAAVKSMSLPGLTLSVESADTGMVQFDLILTIEDRRGELTATFSYNADLFDAERIERMSGHYRRLLEGAVAAPSSPVGELPMLGADELQALARVGSGRQTDLRSEPSIAQMFERQAALRPEAEAVTDARQTLTYGQLESRSNQLAHLLRGEGFGPGSTIGLRLERSAEVAVSLLGVLKAGATVVLVDSATRIRRVIEGAGDPLPDALLTRRPLTTELEKAFADAPAESAAAPKVFCLDALAQRLGGQPTTPPAHDHAAGAAYLLPRDDDSVVSVTHQLLLNRLNCFQTVCALAPGDAVLYRAAAGEDAFVWELLWPLLYGGRAVVSPAGESDFGAAVALAEREQIRVMRHGAGELSRWLDDLSDAEESARSAARAALGSLRWLICRGEYVSPETVASWRGIGRASICQCYVVDGTEVLALIHRGAGREASGDAAGLAAMEAKPDDLTPTPSAVIAGRPLDNVSVSVLDASGRPVPFGVGGEVWVGGESATARTNTGERGRWLADGRLLLEEGEGHGWLNEHRVDYAAVEAALLEQDEVLDCAVRVRRGGRGARLVAYVVSTGRLQPAELSERLSRRLSAGRVPQIYVKVPALPLNPWGGLDEAALRAVPMFAEEDLRKIEARLCRLPGVEDAAVVLEETPQPQGLWHISDLVPAGESAAAVTVSDNGRGNNGNGHGANGNGHHAGIASTAAPDFGHGQEQVRWAMADGGPAVEEPDGTRNLRQMLERAAASSAARGVTFESASASRRLSYAELLTLARRQATRLRAAGVAAGDRVILQAEQAEPFLIGFWGCVLAGAVSVPLAVPAGYEAGGAAGRVLSNVWEVLSEPAVLAGKEEAAGVRRLLGERARVVEVVKEGAAGSSEAVAEGAADLHDAGEEELALLLFTSGSTGQPKGVMLSHRNIAYMSRGIAELNGYTSGEVSLNWMPLTHVGGLVMFHLRDVYLGCEQVQARTDDVLQEPLLWLDMIERHRVSVTWAPNFAFKLVNEQAARIKERSWNLSSLRLIANGGEVVNAQTTMTFLGLLAKDGLAPTVMRPGFGMSETSSSIISSEVLALGSERGLQQIQLLPGGRVSRAADASARARTFVEVGIPARGVQMRIVDADNRLVAEDTVGRLQIRGPQVTSGYFDNPEANREAFCDGGWLNTGDLGFLCDGRLTITGREKDVIIINGANYYSIEVEAVVEAVEGVEGSFTAACAVREDYSDTDKLAIFFHTSLESRAARFELIKRIRERVAADLGVTPDYVLPLEKSEIPKTSIGKIQRSKLRQRFERGEFAGILKELDLAFENSNTVPDWFYREVWVPKAAAHLVPQTPRVASLVFDDGEGLGARVREELERAGSVSVSVSAGTDFRRLSAHEYQLDPADRGQYDRLIASLSNDGLLPRRVLHLWAATGGECAGAEELERAQKVGFYSVLWLVQALARAAQGDAAAAAPEGETGRGQTGFFVVTRRARASRPGTLRDYRHATLPGLLRSLAAEAEWLQVRHLDLDAEAVETETARLLKELRSLKGEAEVSFRAGERLVPRLRKFELAANRKAAAIRRGGLYLVTGGLGGIGTRVCEQLLRRYGVRLLLVGRTTLEDAAAGEASAAAAERRARLSALEAAGPVGACLYRALDVCDLDALRAAVAEAEGLSGRTLDGVFHLAGEENLTQHWQQMESHLAINETPERVGAALRAKVRGTWTLFELLKERREAIFVGFSSMNSVFGAATFSAYAAANSFLDGVTEYQRESGGRPQTWSFNWTMWDDLGMSAGSPDYAREVARSLGYRVMSPEQGAASLLGVLSGEPANVLVGLDSGHEQVRRRLAGTRSSVFGLVAHYAAADDSLPPSEVAAAAAAAGIGAASPFEFRRAAAIPKTPEGTPDRERLLASGPASGDGGPQHAPQGEVEERLVEVWKKVLEVERVGVHDKFFELGGNSLKSLRLLAALNQKFSCRLAIVDLFKYSTVKELGAHIGRLTSGGEGEGVGISGYEF